MTNWSDNNEFDKLDFHNKPEYRAKVADRYAQIRAKRETEGYTPGVLEAIRNKAILFPAIGISALALAAASRHEQTIPQGLINGIESVAHKFDSEAPNTKARWEQKVNENPGEIPETTAK